MITAGGDAQAMGSKVTGIQNTCFGFNQFSRLSK